MAGSLNVPLLCCMPVTEQVRADGRWPARALLLGVSAPGTLPSLPAVPIAAASAGVDVPAVVSENS